MIRGGMMAVIAPKLGPEATVVASTVLALNALKRSAVISSLRCPPTANRFDARQLSEFWLASRRIASQSPPFKDNSPAFEPARANHSPHRRPPAYQKPSSFHQANPTVSQMARLTSDATKPTRHQSPNETYFSANTIGAVVVP